MKRNFILLSVILVFLLVFTTGCGDDRPVINVYNWGDYIDRDTIKDFEEEYGVRVNYEMYETNEDLYVKIKQGGGQYDVIIPSDYMIERMIREDMLAKLNKNNITNIENVDPNLLGLEFDPNNEYSLPYMWGTVGIVYNKTMVYDVVDSWDILWDEKYADQILMLNSQRDTLAAALIRLGFSLNTRSIEELEAAKEELVRQKPLVYAYLGDEMKDVMIGEEAALALSWSGEAFAMIRENPNLEYSIPKEGSNIWVDSMVIPKNAKNKEDAEKFINFMSKPEIAAMNSEYIGYSTPILAAIELLSEDMRNSHVAFPPDEKLKNLEVFKDPMDIISEYDRIWTEITAED